MTLTPGLLCVDPPSRILKPFRVVERQRRGLSTYTVYENDLYEVSAQTGLHFPLFGNRDVTRLGISLIDHSARHDWREFQQIKNMLVGKECEAIELYPAESRLIDPSNYFILWCVCGHINIGINAERSVVAPADAIAPQRGWIK